MVTTKDIATIWGILAGKLSSHLGPGGRGEEALSGGLMDIGMIHLGLEGSSGHEQRDTVSLGQT